MRILMVPRAGLEPASREAEDFETSVSTIPPSGQIICTYTFFRVPLSCVVPTIVGHSHSGVWLPTVAHLPFHHLGIFTRRDTQTVTVTQWTSLSLKPNSNVSFFCVCVFYLCRHNREIRAKVKARKMKMNTILKHHFLYIFDYKMYLCILFLLKRILFTRLPLVRRILFG